MPSPSARCATWRPMRPRPSTPRVFPASSIPVKRWRSQRSGSQRRVRLRHVAREREEQGDGVLGGRVDRRLGGVRDDDAAPRRSIDVDVVDADSGTPDDLELLTTLDEEASSVVADRTMIASKSPMIEARSDWESSTTSNRASEGRDRSPRSARGRGRAGVQPTRAASWYASSARATATPGSIGAPRSTSSASTAVSAVVMRATS